MSDAPAARTRAAFNQPGGLLIAVPLYRTPTLIPDLFAALAAMADEIAALGGRVLLINDSPDDAPLRAALDAALPALAAILAVELIENAGNLGFLRSANRAMQAALDDGRDVVLLNSDALPRPGAFAEMVAVAYLDPLTGFVSPRSDNATICTSPWQGALRSGDREARHAAHRAIERHLPRVTYVPTAVGFCLLVKRLVLAEFGLFDAIYGDGYNEENDLIRRANRRGYRAVLANHAYAHHIGEASFAQTGRPRRDRDTANDALLAARYPEYDRLIGRYFEAADFRAQRLMGGLVPSPDGRIRVLFDCTIMVGNFCGTFEHIRCLLEAFARRHAARFEIGVLCDEGAFCFHGLDRIAGLDRRTEDDLRDRPAAIAFKLGQPFSPVALARLADHAPICGALMLDTIALDCQQLDRDDLTALWQTMNEAVDLIGYNSAFSAAQYQRRFAVPNRVVQFVSLCSVDPADYDVGAAAPGGGGVLLIGNHYPHKHVAETLDALRAAGCRIPVTVFGTSVEPREGVASYVAGMLPQEQVDGFYANADVVLFPSHYEGFGLPIMHALARRRPVIARDLPCAREIRAATPAGANLHLAATTAELVALATDPPAWAEPAPPASPAYGWGAAADAIARAFDDALDRFDFAACRRHQSLFADVRRRLAAEHDAHRLRDAEEARDRAEAALDTEREDAARRLAVSRPEAPAPAPPVRRASWFDPLRPLRRG